MDESILEGAERAQLAQVANEVNKTSKDALSSDDLAPHEFIHYECVECGEDLCMFRMKKGRSRCVSCQTNIEKGRNPRSKALLIG